jgi:threonine dehydrogenase-like Zn-dependent dehydrogenase
VTLGHIKPGLQTGYCRDTGGGWGQRMVAHVSQLHAVPDGLGDERAVLVEPLASSIHSVLRGRPEPGDDVLIVGAGTVGVLCLIGLRALSKVERITVVAKHSRQRDLMRALGADEVVPSTDAVSALRRSTHAQKLEPEFGTSFLMGGVDIAYDCAGTHSSLDLALRTTRAGGRVVLSGIPASAPDLTPLWFRELELVGAYTTGIETMPETRERRGTFDVAIELAQTAPLDGLVSARYSLARWREALDHALSAGRLGAVKIAFDPTIGGAR